MQTRFKRVWQSRAIRGRLNIRYTSLVSQNDHFLKGMQTLLTGGILNEETGPPTKKRLRKDQDESDEEKVDNDNANGASASGRFRCI